MCNPKVRKKPARCFVGAGYYGIGPNLVYILKIVYCKYMKGNEEQESGIKKNEGQNTTMA